MSDENTEKDKKVEKNTQPPKKKISIKLDASSVVSASPLP